MANFDSLNMPAGQIGDAQLSDQLRTNICAFLDWSLLGIGAFNNVHLTDVAPYGGNPSKLRLSDDPRYPSGQIWEGFKNNWCWENNTNYSTQPIQISGVWLNSVFIPLTGTPVYNISYPQGRVIFSSPIPVSSVVQVEYSYKLYSVYPDNVQWFRKLTQSTSRIDDPQFNSQGSGIWSILPESRVQLPAVVVESVPNRDFIGKQLGGGQWIYTDIYFHVMSTVEPLRDNLLDILTYQNTKKFYLFDKNAMRASGVYPLNNYGYLVNPQSTYPYLVNNFLARYGVIERCTSQTLSNNSQSIFRGTAKWRIQIDFPEI